MNLKQRETEKTFKLHRRAEKGDMQAGRELIALCRRGMLAPEWERPSKVTRASIEEHLKRRDKVMRKGQSA